MRNLRIAALIVGAGLLSMGGIAFAAGDSWATKVKLNFDPRDSGDFFEGTVSSENPSCVKGRKVIVKYVDEGEKIGGDKTDARGTFEVAVSGAAASGTYKAIAKPLKTNRFSCKKGVDTYEEEHTG